MLCSKEKLIKIVEEIFNEFEKNIKFFIKKSTKE
jgi:hypothetical protein